MAIFEIIDHNSVTIRWPAKVRIVQFVFVERTVVVANDDSPIAGVGASVLWLVNRNSTVLGNIPERVSIGRIPFDQ